jgi:hypothetical protein
MLTTTLQSFLFLAKSQEMDCSEEPETTVEEFDLEVVCQPKNKRQNSKQGLIRHSETSSRSPQEYFSIFKDAKRPRKSSSQRLSFQDGNNQTFTCPYCDKKFFVPFALNNHVKKHLQTTQTVSKKSNENLSNDNPTNEEVEVLNEDGPLQMKKNISEMNVDEEISILENGVPVTNAEPEQQILKSVNVDGNELSIHSSFLILNLENTTETSCEKPFEKESDILQTLSGSHLSTVDDDCIDSLLTLTDLDERLTFSEIADQHENKILTVLNNLITANGKTDKCPNTKSSQKEFFNQEDNPNRGHVFIKEEFLKEDQKSFNETTDSTTLQSTNYCDNSKSNEDDISDSSRPFKSVEIKQERKFGVEGSIQINYVCSSCGECLSDSISFQRHSKKHLNDSSTCQTGWNIKTYFTNTTY